MNRKKCLRIGFMCICLIIACIGCGKKKDYNDGKTYYSVPSPEESSEAHITNSYDATMTAVVKYNNKEIGIVILLDSKTGEEYTMTYGNTIQIIDKYGENKDISYLENGDVVKAYYLKNAIVLTAVEYTNDVWEYTLEDNWEIDTNENSVSVGGSEYYYNDNQFYVLSEGTLIQIQELSPQDVVSIRGIGRQALSVNVDSGHGYIKLTGVDNFIDGWVQVGKTIKPVSSDMLLVAPEGTYDVKIVKEGYGGAVNTTVARNQEVTVDFSDVASRVIQYGTVEFTILPQDAAATLKISGKETGYSTPVLLEYGTYNVTIEAEGYEKYTGRLNVGQNLSQITVNLTKVTASASPTSSASPTISPTVSPASTSGSDSLITVTEEPSGSELNTISVTEPEGVKVYFDDEYKGVAPVSFDKVSGSHTLTLSKDGYVTKTYSLDVSESDDNVTYCMPALVQETN